jgi:hypothetical protein
MEWACANCPRRRAGDLHPYTRKLLRLRGLQLGGYPFAADDLSLEEWTDLGQLKAALAALQPNPTRLVSE